MQLEIKVVRANRLAWFREPADAEFWDRHWLSLIKKYDFKTMSWAAFGELQEPMRRYLPPQGRILEAGCGVGWYVAALRAKGYDAEGVEWGERTVQAVRVLNPELPIRAGDVTRLDVPDGHYTGYISLGVVEHREEGPGPFLKEAFRILAPGGVALISVPWFHLLRRLKARLGCYRAEAHGLDFYQYAFSTAEMQGFLEAAGFRVEAYWPYDGFKGAKDEIPLLQWLRRWPWWEKRLLRWLNVERVRWKCGHMLMFVCRKG